MLDGFSLKCCYTLTCLKIVRSGTLCSILPIFPHNIVNYFQVMKHEEKLELTDYMQVNGFELISICGLGN